MWVFTSDTLTLFSQWRSLEQRPDDDTIVRGSFSAFKICIDQILNRPGGGLNKPRLTSKSGRTGLVDELLDEKARRFALQHTDPRRVRASTQAARDNQELLCGVRAHLPNDEALFLVMRAVLRTMREQQLDDA